MQSSRIKRSRITCKQVNEDIANNEHILTQILALLPVKSLLRFQSVSNDWMSLISRPDFHLRLRHDHHSPSGILLPTIFFCSSVLARHINSEYDFISFSDKLTSSAPPLRSLDYLDDSPGIRILQSCNGLLLCSRFENANVDNYYICNPTTKKFVSIPHPICNSIPIEYSLYENVYGINLAFDPAKSFHYKLICIRKPTKVDARFQNNNEVLHFIQIEIYSSETRTWRISGDPFPVYSGIAFKNGVFCNGAVHWTSAYGNGLYFNVDEEQFHDLPMLPVPDDWDKRRCSYLGGSRGHLHLIEMYRAPATQFDVYEMGEKYAGWSVKYRVNLEGVKSAFPDMMHSGLEPSDVFSYLFEVLCIVRGVNDEEATRMVLHLPGKIITYNLQDKSFRKIGDIEYRQVVDGRGNQTHTFQKFWWSHVYNFVESLCPV